MFRKDVRNAVEAAHKGYGVWSKKTGFNRSQILFYLAENFEQRKEEFVKFLIRSGRSEEDSRTEVDTCTQRMFHWASFCDKFGGEVKEPTVKLCFSCQNLVLSPIFCIL